MKEFGDLQPFMWNHAEGGEFQMKMSWSWTYEPTYGPFVDGLIETSGYPP